MGWLTGWQYRKSHVINYAGGAGTNYQVCVKVYKATGTDGTETIDGHTAGKVYVGVNCRDDFGDVRFADDDGTTVLDYWMENKSDGSWAIFWLEVADDLSTVNATIYVYYGKSDATYVGNIDNTFLFGDEFTTSIDWTTKWASADQTKYSVEAGELKCAGATAANHIRTQSTFNAFAVKYKHRAPYTNQAFYVSWIPATSWTGLDYTCLYWYASNNPVYCTLNGSAQTAANQEDLSNSFHGVYLCPSSGDATLTIYKLGSQICQKVGTPAQRTVRTVFLEGISGCYGYVDWVFIRKYISPEPSHGAWGSEETPGQIYEIYMDAIAQSLSSPTEECTFNISKDASVASQAIHTPESTFNISEDAITQASATHMEQTTFNIPKDAIINALADVLVEVVVGVIEIFKDAIATAQATFTLESAFNINKDAVTQTIASVGVETLFNIVKDAIAQASATPQILGIYPINLDALVKASAVTELQQTLGISQDAVVAAVSTPLIQSTFNLSPEAVVEVLAEVSVVKEGEVKVTKLFLILGNIAIQIQGSS